MPDDDKGQTPLKSLEKDLRYYEESIKEVSDDVLKSNSQFPIFVASDQEVKLGEMILDRKELGTNWSVHVSTLQEFIEKGLVLPEKQDYFEMNYKDPQKFMCLFVIVPEGANFVFYPYH